MLIGIGNPDRGDDGIGVRLVAELASRLPRGCNAMTCSGDVVSLIDGWHRFDALVCIDAAEPDGCPGRIQRFDLAVAPLPVLRSSVSSHAVGLSEAVALAKALAWLPKDVIVYAVEGEQFLRGAALSPAVANAMHGVTAHIVAELERLMYKAVMRPGNA